MSEADSKALVETTVFQKNGITFLPHYRNSSVFVGPGYPNLNAKRYSAEELLEAGAIKQYQMLWSRGNFGPVTDEHP